MPLRRICSAPGCSRLTEGSSKYCGLHQYKEAEDRKKEEERREKFFSQFNSSRWPELYNTKQWKVLRDEQLKNFPICQKCGCYEATEVHHVIPHRGDPNLFFNPENLVSLCHDCHTEETRKEIQIRSKQASAEYQKQKRIRKLWY